MCSFTYFTSLSSQIWLQHYITVSLRLPVEIYDHYMTEIASEVIVLLIYCRPQKSSLLGHELVPPDQICHRRSHLEMFYTRASSEKFLKIHMKTTISELFLNKAFSLRLNLHLFIDFILIWCKH